MAHRSNREEEEKLNVRGYLTLSNAFTGINKVLMEDEPDSGDCLDVILKTKRY